MNIEIAKEKINELTETIKFHNDLYYFQDRNIISDAEYDRLMVELQKLEHEYPNLAHRDSPTKRVGDKLKDELKKVKHNVPMLSIQAVFEKQEIMQFVDRMKAVCGADIKFIVEPKIDGLSVGLRYVNGQFKEGMTRGDGIYYGEDVTDNLKMIETVSLQLPEALPYMEIRGEVYCTDHAFEAANKIQLEKGNALFENSRNCASATLRQPNCSLLKQRELSIFIFDIQEIKGRNFRSDSDQLAYLRQQGIRVLEGCVLCNTGEDVWRSIQNIGNSSNRLGYQIDGAVVKVDTLSHRKKIGITEKVPKWALAYKYNKDNN